MFDFDLDQEVTISISGECGFVKGRAEYLESHNQYYIHYKAADGRAVDNWFSGSELEAVE